MSKNQMPRRTSVKEINEADEIDVLKILSDPYPNNVDDYAVQLYFKTNSRKHNVKVTKKKIIDNTKAEFVIDDSKCVTVNIQTGDIKETAIMH